MNYQIKFDSFLKENKTEEAFKWVMDKLSWNPDNLELKGMSAFLLCFFNQKWAAKIIAEKLLREEDPNEEWSLATIFITSHNFEILNKFSFVDETGFQLNHKWIDRFIHLKQEDEAKKMIYCLSLYGSPAQRAMLSENWLVTSSPNNVLEKQLDLL